MRRGVIPGSFSLKVTFEKLRYMKKILSALFIFAALAVSAQDKIYAPTLTAPANGALNQAVNVLLDWNPVSGGVAYEINLDTSATFSNPLVVTVQYSAWQTSELLFGTTYYWRVRAIDASSAVSAWSQVRSLITIASPTGTSPSQSSTYACLQPVLTWSQLSGVSMYECEFDSVNTFDSPYFRSQVVSNTNKFQVYGNQFGEVYYYRVRGMHSKDTSAWSPVVSFITRDSTVYTSNSIEDLAIDVHPVDTIRIKGIVGAKAYEIYFDTDPSFSAPIIFKWDSLAINVRNVSGLLNDTTARGPIDTIPFGSYYYKLHLLTDGDTSKWTSVRRLTTISKVVMTSPADDEVDVLVYDDFAWDAIRGAQYYILEYGTDPTFATTTKVSVSGTTYSPATNFLSQTDYYWRVRCVTASDTTDAWDEYHFKTYFGVGVEENTSATWSVYPNPTTGVFYLNLESSENARLEVLNVIGDVVLSQNNLVNGTNTVSIDGLNDGIYMMRLYMNDKVYTSRIVKK